MKKILLPFLFALLGATNVWAADGDVFTAPVQVVKDGVSSTVDMRFQVKSEANKTCFTFGNRVYLPQLNVDGHIAAIDAFTEGELILPEKVNGYSITGIGNYSFLNCALSEISFSETTISAIGDSAFCNCQNLKAISIPGHAEYVGRIAFGDCKQLASVSLSCDYIPYGCFYKCNNLKNVELRSPVHWVGGLAFGYCTSIEALSFPDGLETIEEAAFGQCEELKCIYIPKTLYKLNSSAFNYCHSLKNVIIERETPPSIELSQSGYTNPFVDLPSNAVLHVPNRTKYNSEPWTSFSEIKSFQPTVEKTISAYFNSSGKLTYVLSYSETIDPNDILDLVIDGEPQLPEVNSGYLTVSKDVTKIPQEVSFLWRKSEGVVPYKLHYDVKNLGFKINGKSMTTLDLYNVPGLVSGEANIITDSDGNPILVLDEAKFEWNDDNYGLLNQSCNLTIQVNSNSTIIADKYEGLKLNESTKTVIGGSGFATLTILSKRAAIDVGDMTHLTIQDGTKVIAQGDSYGYLDSGIYDGDGAYLEIKDGSVFAASGNTESVSLGYRDVILGSGIDLRYPVGATLWNGSVYNADGSKVKGDWAVFGPDNQATQELIDSLTSSFIRGDVNLDGTVDIADAVCVLNRMAGQPVAGDANVNGDYDEDGNPVIDIADLVTILNIMAGQ